jgi:hypothetical protein
MDTDIVYLELFEVICGACVTMNVKKVYYIFFLIMFRVLCFRLVFTYIGNS